MSHTERSLRDQFVYVHVADLFGALIGDLEYFDDSDRDPEDSFVGGTNISIGTVVE